MLKHLTDQIITLPKGAPFTTNHPQKTGVQYTKKSFKVKVDRVAPTASYRQKDAMYHHPAHITWEGEEGYYCEMDLHHIIEGGEVKIMHNHPNFHDERGAEMGYQLESFSLWVKETCLGYLKVANMTPESWEAANPTPYHYMTHRGWCGPNLKPEATAKEIVEGYHSYLELWREKPRNWSEDKCQDHLSYFEKGMSFERILENYTQDKAFFVNSPYVDFSRIHKPYRRRGYATLLYLHASKELAKRGLYLRASGCQSEGARKLWKQFKILNLTRTVKLGRKTYLRL
jgi:GNAT superfamily N-acetyltransferase